MEWLNKLNAAIDYIENHLDSEISYEEAAKIACCSTFYFQRLFTYISGVSLSEYIRRRRMTQAAFELQRTEKKVLAVAMTFVMTNLQKIRPGFNSCFIVRYLLKKADCTKKAISLLMKLPVASNCNILIADKKGELFVVECTPNEKRVREALNLDKGKIVCAVNSFTSDKKKRHDAAGKEDYRSVERYRTVVESFRTKIDGNLIEKTQQLLRGDYGFLCQYDDIPDFETVWSSVFDLRNRMIYQTEGDPRTKKFIEDSRLHDIVRSK